MTFPNEDFNYRQDFMHDYRQRKQSRLILGSWIIGVAIVGLIVWVCR